VRCIRCKLQGYKIQRFFFVIDLQFKEGAGLPEAERIVIKELTIDPSDAGSFYPIAEMFMGLRAKEIPLRKRTLDAPKASILQKKRKSGKEENN
jgi:hypothetical protein